MTTRGRTCIVLAALLVGCVAGCHKPAPYIPPPEHPSEADAISEALYWVDDVTGLPVKTVNVDTHCGSHFVVSGTTEECVRDEFIERRWEVRLCWSYGECQRYSLTVDGELVDGSRIAMASEIAGLKADVATLGGDTDGND